MLVTEHALPKSERYEAFEKIGEEIMAVATYGVTQYQGVRESINEASLCEGGAEVLASYSHLNKAVQVSFTVKQSQGYAPMAKLTAFVSVAELDEIIEVLTLAKVDAVRANHAPEPSIDEHPEDAPEAPPHEER